MQNLIATAADDAGVPLFRRFAVMRYWHDQPDASTLVGDDGLHMNDAGYGCLATGLADALVANWNSQLKTAQTRPVGKSQTPALAVIGRAQAGTDR